MAKVSILYMWLFLATLALPKPSVSSANAAYVANGKGVHELREDSSRKNISVSENDLQVQKSEMPSVLSLEEARVDDLSNTKPPGDRIGNLRTTAAFRPSQESAKNMETYLDHKSDLFPRKEDETVLAVEDASQISLATTGHASLEESLWTLQHLSLMQPVDSNKLELNSKSKSSTILTKNEETKVISTQKLPKSSQKENYVETAQDSTAQSLSTGHPTVSTIRLVTSAAPNFSKEIGGPVTPIQKLQIDSDNKQESEALLNNSVEFHEVNYVSSYVTSAALRKKIENNFLDDNLRSQLHEVEPSEKYNSAYRTTESYSVLREIEPDGNEVISADIELIHTNDNQHYQKDSNAIPEESMVEENETKPSSTATDLQAKQQAAPDMTPPTRISIRFLPSEPPLNKELSTLQSHLSKTNLPYPTVDHKKHFTLEAKSRTQTERLSTSPTLQKSFKVENDSIKMEDFAKGSAVPVKGQALTEKGLLVGTAPPGLVMSTTWKKLITKQQENVPELDPLQTGVIATPQAFPNNTRRTGRRGEIRVTTQRAVRRPQVAPNNLPSVKPTLDAPLCSKTGGTCEFLGSNRTLISWDDLQRTLSFAWDMHVYGTAVLFLLLSLVALINLIGSPILKVSYLPYIIVSNALLFIIGILRGVFFVLDPYGSKSEISPGIALVLYNITFPLMLSTFATLLLLVLKIAHLQLLPPKIQSLPLLAVIGVIHFIILLSADLLAHFLNPSVNIVLQVISVSWGIFLMVGNVVAYFQLRKCSKDITNETHRVSPTCEDIVVVQTQGTNIKCLFTSSRVLLVGSIFGLLCCGLQVYAVLWLHGLLGKRNEFSWPWWFLQFWFRIFELSLCFAMLFVASHIFCVQCGSSDHSCWSKIISYFCTYKKTEVPEYPNNCYDWTNSIQDRIVNNNINKSLIRNQSENVPLRILKENNETKSSTIFSNNSRSSSPLFRPKPESVFGPKSQNVHMGRSYTSICFEKESMLSLTDLEFRPPSPINLSRSIDEALFREHLVRDSIFLDSSLQYPNYLNRQDSCSSLKDCSALNQTVDPLISSDLKMRRCSNPDYMYSLGRCNSVTEVDTPTESLQESKELPHDVITEGVVSVSSLDSVSKGSIKISWNPWRHGLSSVESLPLEDTPESQLLKQDSQPSIISKSSEPEKTLSRRLIERSQTTDSHSIASETIEL
ncbi:proline-rich transmembrane protein 3 [Pelobates fuscus]|uniref:proline-rich transmembrane protein 3 n=1 Tax=Pelobates fuscus TaxID=191477 RepID=UPI002FE484B1